jgi:PIN domain nuclease of toxin-antitoxin system
MRVLLDTHALIWALEDSPSLSPTARSVILDSRNEILVSAVSAWEIAIKKALGRLEAPDDLAAAIEDAGFLRKDLTITSAEYLAQLPLHHRDPFDRMLIAQVLEDGIPLVSGDRQLAPYPVQILW